MKILLVNDFWQAGGAESVFRQTGENLEQKADVVYHYKYKNYQHSDGLFDYIYSITNRKVLLKTLFDEKPDIVHIHNYYHVLSPSILHALRIYKKTNKVKVIITAHDYHLICPNSGLTHFRSKNGVQRLLRINKPLSTWNKLSYRFDSRGFLYSTAKKIQWIIAYDFLKLYNVFDLILSPSNFLKNCFELHNPALPTIRVVRNPIKIEFPESVPLKNRTHPERLKIIFFGRISPEKGLAELFESLSRIPKYKFSLDIYGSGDIEFLDHLNSKVRQYDLDENISFKGYANLDQLNSAMNDMDAAILPSLWYENAPLSLIEASVKGLQILTLDYGGMREMAEIAGNFQLFEQENFQSLELAIDKILRDINSSDRNPLLTEKSPDIENMMNYDNIIFDIYQNVLSE